MRTFGEPNDDDPKGGAGYLTRTQINTILMHVRPTNISTAVPDIETQKIPVTLEIINDGYN